MWISWIFALASNKCIEYFCKTNIVSRKIPLENSAATMSVAFLWILLLFCSCELLRAQQSPCSKIDFNRPVVSGFQNCTKQYVPMFEVRKYEESPWLEPYRPSSQYFISNGVEGYSCGESISRFQLDANSEIDAAIYLNFQFPGAFIEVLVIDTDAKKTVNRWKNETAGGWFLLSRKININVRNAQVFYYTSIWCERKKSVINLYKIRLYFADRNSC